MVRNTDVVHGYGLLSGQVLAVERPRKVDSFLGLCCGLAPERGARVLCDVIEPVYLVLGALLDYE